MAKKQKEEVMGVKFSAIRSKLMERKKTLMENSTREMKNIISGANRDYTADEGDEAAFISQDHTIKSMLVAQSNTVKSIDAALAKMDEGEYGICEDCGEDIPEKRLAVLPFATMCVFCQESKEKYDKMNQNFGFGGTDLSFSEEAEA